MEGAWGGQGEEYVAEDMLLMIVMSVIHAGDVWPNFQLQEIRLFP